ncbi:MAG: hypothetical protein RL154_142 [Pseudomonadota bacterium]|jgi:flagellar motor component MotA
MSNWIDEFRVAIINTDVSRIVALHEQMPSAFQDETLQTVKTLLDSAIVIMEGEKIKTLKALEALRMSKEYVFMPKTQSQQFEYKL